MQVKLKTPFQGHDSGTVVEVSDQDGADLLTRRVADFYVRNDAPIKVTADLSVDNPQGGFKGLWEFVHDVWQADRPAGHHSKKLQAWTEKAPAGMSEGTPSDGGHLVPPEYSRRLLQTSLENTIVRKRATFLPMATNQVSVPAVGDYDHTEPEGLFGGILLYRPGEGGVKTSSKPKFEKVTLTLHKLIALCYASDELLEDSAISIEPMINQMFGKAIAWQEDNDFISGSGSAMALGILNAPCVINQSRDTASEVQGIDLLNMWARLLPSSQGSAVWLASPDTIPEIYQACTICEGSDGSDLCGTQLLTSDGSLAKDFPTQLFGRPLIFTEHASALGDTGDVILADFSHYLVGGKSTGVDYDTSIHLRFDYDETAFRAVQRYDGQPWMLQAQTPKHSSNTLSPFIALQTGA